MEKIIETGTYGNKNFDGLKTHRFLLSRPRAKKFASGPNRRYTLELHTSDTSTCLAHMLFYAMNVLEVSVQRESVRVRSGF